VNEVRDQLDLRLFAQQMHGLATSGIGAAKP
jgi:hypothetical protein